MFPTKQTAYLDLIWYLPKGNHNVTCCIGENKLGILLLSLGDLNLLKKSFGKIAIMSLALKVVTRK